MKFKLFIQNLSGSEKWEIPFDSFSISEELNNDRSASFSFNRQTIDAVAVSAQTTIDNIFISGYRECYLYDQDDNLVYSGFVDEYQTSAGMSEKGTLSISSRGFFSLLNKRFTNAPRVYSSEDAGDIAWDLIDYTQGLTYGDLGITRGVHPTTKNRDRTFRYENIAEAIQKLSNHDLADGFDFEIDNSKVFNIYYPERGSYRKNVVLERGFNIDTYNIIQNGLMNLINQAYVMGDGYGEDMLVVTRDAENVYKNNYGLLQEALSEKDIKTTDTLNDKGDLQLNLRKFPRKTINVTLQYENPQFTNYQIGDRIKVIISQENVNGFYRALKRTLSDDGTVYLTLYPL